MKSRDKDKVIYDVPEKYLAPEKLLKKFEFLNSASDNPIYKLKVIRNIRNSDSAMGESSLRRKTKFLLKLLLFIFFPANFAIAFPLLLYGFLFVMIALVIILIVENTFLKSASIHNKISFSALGFKYKQEVIDTYLSGIEPEEYIKSILFFKISKKEFRKFRAFIFSIVLILSGFYIYTIISPQVIDGFLNAGKGGISGYAFFYHFTFTFIVFAILLFFNSEEIFFYRNLRLTLKTMDKLETHAKTARPSSYIIRITQSMFQIMGYTLLLIPFGLMFMIFISFNFMLYGKMIEFFSGYFFLAIIPFTALYVFYAIAAVELIEKGLKIEDPEYEIFKRTAKVEDLIAQCAAESAMSAN